MNKVRKHIPCVLEHHQMDRADHFPLYAVPIFPNNQYLIKYNTSIHFTFSRQKTIFDIFTTGKHE